MEDWLGFLVILGVATAAVSAWTRRLPSGIARLAWIGFVLRVVGSVARYEVLMGYYDGVGDASGYYSYGLYYADALRQFDFSVLDSEHWMSGRLWGTQFIRYLSAVTLILVGSSFRGEFLAFSMISFAGLIFLARSANGRDRGWDPNLCAWLWLLPSLWFWPCSVGKEAPILLGAGLFAYGYTGAAAIRWSWLLAGIAVTAAIRPHIAAVLCAGAVAAEVLTPAGTAGRGGPIRTFAVCVVSLVVAVQSASALGLDPLDAEEVGAFVDSKSAQTMQGGSALEASSGLASLPLGLVNVFFRPFLWESHSPLALLSALEVTGLWVLIYRRRRTVMARLRDWSTSRNLRFGLACALLLGAAYGITFFNMGILARQRVLAFAFFLVILAEPLARRASPPGPTAWRVIDADLARRLP